MKTPVINTLFGLCLLSIVSFTGCNTSNQEPKAKYVFYFIGDGMGFQQITVTQAYMAAMNKQTGNAALSFSDFPVTGVAETYAYNRYITGSAAAGTALSTGSKTSINTIGLNFDHSDTLYSVAHSARKAGLQVGVATSVSIDHATPAAFYAHQADRNMYHRIAHDMLRSGYRFFAGGGLRDPEGVNSTTSLGNVFDQGKEMGFYFSNNLTIHDTILSAFPTIVYSCANPSSGSSIKYNIDRDSSDVTLADITQMGIDVLDNPKGFFLMVEGGKIDWACHDNDAASTVHDVIAFSDAIAVALEFYQQHPHETLIVITADHETGGLSMGNLVNGYQSNISVLSNQKHSLEELSSIVVHFKEQHHGKPTLKQVLNLLADEDIMGLHQDLISPELLEELTRAYHASVAPQTPEQKKANSKRYGSNDPIAVTAVRVLNQLAGVGWTTLSHTGSHVPIYAMGAGQSLFSGQMNNTDIPKRIALAMGIQHN